MTTAVEAIEELRHAAADGRLAALCAERGVDLLGVFGSAVASLRPGGHRAEPRDLDVAMRFSEPNRSDLLGLIDDLTRLSGYERFDIVDLSTAPVPVRKAAMFGLGLFEARTGEWARVQMHAFGEWRDTEWLRRLDLELMSR